MNIADLLTNAIARLSAAGVPDPRVDAQWLLAELLNCRRGDLQLSADQELPDDSIQHFHTMIQRRVKREPLQYILGYEEFYGHRFIVNPAVLIPRPETEQLIDLALALCASGPKHILDIGTGSGCIAITLALANPQAELTAIDLSVDALRVARDNARHHGVDENIRLLAADLFHIDAPGPFDLIVSNPPYVEAAGWNTVQPEVREFEPVQALLAGDDGLDIIRRIIAESPRYLRNDGSLILEFGRGQEQLIAQIIDDSPTFTQYAFAQDLEGVTRFVTMKRA